MSPLLWLGILAGTLIIAAFFGPTLIERSAPVLAATPRLAAGALSAAALLWITGLFFVGPVVAWLSRGPEWLPAHATEICQRCLAATSPFGSSDLTFAIPAFIPLSVPFIGAVLILVGLIREWRNNRAAGEAVIRDVTGRSTLTELHGHRLWLTDDPDVAAFAVPTSRGGIVVSRGAVELLSESELRSVLAHEQAHLDQRHHAWLTSLYGATHFFRWIPLVGAVRETLPPFLEIAADQAAGRVTGVTAVAAALFKFGRLESNLTPTTLRPAPTVVLKAVGSERVRSLVGAAHPEGAKALAVTLLVCGCMLLIAVGVVHWPYVLGLLTGC